MVRTQNCNSPLKWLSPLLVFFSACSGSSGESGSACSHPQQQNLTAALDSLNPSPPFALLLQRDDGQRYSYYAAGTGTDYLYPSASTSKWVAATMILRLTDAGLMNLEDTPGRYISFWPESGNAAEITLHQLLSFTSGLDNEPLCLNLGGADFSTCVSRILAENQDTMAVPGSHFYYSASHLQVAGLMAVNAAGVEDWATLFDQFRSTTGLFSGSAFDLPSATNPRLAGGMHWTASDYRDFLSALSSGQLLSDASLSAMLSNQTLALPQDYSPATDATGETWPYGYGNWLECSDPGCTTASRHSSPGAYGAYPFTDNAGFSGLIARYGELGSFQEGYQQYIAISTEIQDWASSDCED